MCEVMKKVNMRVDPHKVDGTGTVQNWTGYYNEFLGRCEEISLANINILKVHHHDGWSEQEMGTRLCSMSLFIILHNDGKGVLEKQWSPQIVIVHMPEVDN